MHGFRICKRAYPRKVSRSPQINIMALWWACAVAAHGDPLPRSTCHPVHKHPSGSLASAAFFAVLCFFVGDFVVESGPRAQEGVMCLTEKYLC